jgi:LPS sulfotransferase NodH
MKSVDASFLPFVLIFQGRCGSTYLMEALGSHPDVYCRMEYFAMLKQRRKTAEDQLTWLKRFYTLPPPEPRQVLGFKTKLADVLDRNGFAGVLKDHSAHIIHLQRRNRVKTTISFFNSVRLADSTGDWNLYDGSRRLTPLTIEPTKFDAWLKGVEKAAQDEMRFVEALELPTLSLCYEEMLEDEQKTLERIFSFLGLESRIIKGRAIKATSDNLRDAVENFDALKSRYEGTRYESMFEETIAGH